ncbi:hypothetical protein CK219_20405 [Mesorhizobium sp. WSM4313]|nr:hypothetical protein CK219_20405 [Mesorhizobium sp. WSM4313]
MPLALLPLGTTMLAHRLGQMEQLRSDFAAIAQPGYWIALGLLIIPYGVGVFFLIRICHCM